MTQVLLFDMVVCCRFLVGAPLATVKDKSAPKSVRKLKRPGAVYVCPMSPELDDCKYVVINGE